MKTVPTRIENRPHSSRVLSTPNSVTSQSNYASHGMLTKMGDSSRFSCCCGRPQCAYLQHNSDALVSLESDLRSAAHLGQNLLIRHEAYVASAENDRHQMAASIERLEEEKRELDAANAQTAVENQNLKDDLEELNNDLSNSDARIQSLTSALESTRGELERLNMLAAHSSRLEAQLLDMELDQSRLQSQLESTELDCRSASQRWKSAERVIVTLQEHVDRIEEEAREERAKHEEVLLQFEQRRLVERGLENAAGRLKGAAAATTIGMGQGKNNVVSDFVTDILQDNANLQLEIVELRELLANSNEEIETLREQMLFHQPMVPFNENGVAPAHLKSELAISSATESRSELHVHHHYHPVGRLIREKPQGARRPRKPRNFTSSGLVTPRTGLRNPRTPDIRIKGEGGGAGLKSINHQNAAVHRWSTELAQAEHSIAPSTVPSSPRSIRQNPSIFDTLESTIDFSRPTSPESFYVGSSRLSAHLRASSDMSFASLSTPSEPKPTSLVPKCLPVQSRDDPTLEHLDACSDTTAALQDHQNNYHLHSPNNINQDLISIETNNPLPPPKPPIRPPLLHRSTSHESILSIPSTPFRRPPLPSHLFHNPSMLPSRATLTQHTPATVTALPTSSPAFCLSSSTYNRTILSHHLRGPPNSYVTAANDPSFSNPRSSRSGIEPAGIKPPLSSKTLGKRVGGWVLGKWAGGLTPMASTGDLRAQASGRGNGNGNGRDRATGVNQKGPVRGLKGGMEKGVVVVGVIDEGLLKESLGEG